MNDTIEIFSATDPPHVPDRQVWYWLEFRGMRSERRTEWGPINRHAEALIAEHDAVVIDRSDKESGYLRSTL